MKKVFTANVWQEEDLIVAQCLEVDVASQGKTENEALANLKDALKLHFESPKATIIPELRTVEVEIGAS